MAWLFARSKCATNISYQGQGDAPPPAPQIDKVWQGVITIISVAKQNSQQKYLFTLSIERARISVCILASVFL